jgi:Cdc6-like AAA superfamily ATPase
MNLDVLNYDYIPKRIPYRMKEEREIMGEVQKFLKFKNTRNLVIYGLPGIGKTLISKKIIDILDEELDGYIDYYNLWILNDNEFVRKFAEDCGIFFNANLTKSDVLDRVNEKITDEKTFSILFLDEIDKISDEQLIYILEEKLNAMFIFITNDEDFFDKLDKRIVSRLNFLHVTFNPYKRNEIFGILNERVSALRLSIDKDVLDIIVNETYKRKDIRFGLFVIREMIINETEFNVKL